MKIVLNVGSRANRIRSDNGFTSYVPTSPSTRVPEQERILEVTSISYYLVYLTHRKITSIKYNFFLFTRFLTQYKH